MMTVTSNVDDAVEQARSAASARPEAPAVRAGWLRAIADRLDDSSEELVPLAGEETGLGAVRLRGEVARTTAQLRLFASALEEGSYLEVTIDHPDPGATPPIPDLRRMLVPLGPVAVYGASNFPFAFSVAGGDTASALAAGCPVIVKAHPGHPGTSRAVAAHVLGALEAAGAPRGMFSLVEGFEDGIALIDHPDVTAAAFTGSTRGGRALADRAAARPRPIPFFGELGSTNPVVVTSAADHARGAALAEGLAQSFLLGAGQFCTKPGIVLVPEGSQLESSIMDATPRDRQTMLTPQIAEAYLDGFEQVRKVPGVETLLTPGAPGEPGLLAVAAEDFAQRGEELDGEIFGPVTLLVRYRDEAELRTALEVMEGSLTGTLHCEPGEDVEQVLDLLRARCGRILFEGWPTGVAVSWAQHHGGPWPSTTSQHTSVGVSALRRFLRPIAYQSAPSALLPPELREDNPCRVPRRVDGRMELPEGPTDGA